MWKRIPVTLLSLGIVAVSMGYGPYGRAADETASASCEGRSLPNVSSEARKIEANIRRYVSETKDIVGETTEGGEQTTYTHGSNVVLVHQLFYGETGQAKVRFYLNNGKVFYIIKEDSEYIRPLSQDASAEIKSSEVTEFVVSENRDVCAWYKNKVRQADDPGLQGLVRHLITGIE